jgi:oligopeptide/dipeptide ABC transporter ATP-binding protein
MRTEDHSDQRNGIELSGVSIEFPDPKHTSHRAVDDVSLELRRGERVGVVGESGCGKSLTALACLGLVPEPGCIVEGSIHIDGEAILDLDERDLNRIRGGCIGIVFQEAKSAFNPVYTIGYQIAEVIRYHGSSARQQARSAAIQILGQLGFSDPSSVLASYPHQLSGGEAQRAMIALVLAAEPAYLIADEPTTALDVTIQAQVLGRLNHMVEQRSLGLLLVSHDLTIVRGMVDRVVVMYAGEVVEQGSAAQVLDTALHPYTRLLVNVARNTGNARLTDPPEFVSLPAQGCRFEPRCRMAQPDCSASRPKLELRGGGRLCRCPFAQDQEEGQ